MKKINLQGLRALIVETLEEVSLGEAKKKMEEVGMEDENPGPNPEQDVGTGMDNPDFDMGDKEVENMSTTEIQKEKSKIDKAFEFYEQDPGDASLPILVTTLETSLKFIKSLLPQERE